MSLISVLLVYCLLCLVFSVEETFEANLSLLKLKQSNEDIVKYKFLSFNFAWNSMNLFNVNSHICIQFLEVCSFFLIC